MIISIAPVGPSRLRRAFAFVACTGLMASLFYFLDSPVSPAPNVRTETAQPAGVFVGDPEIARPPASGAFEDAATAAPSTRRSADAVHPVSAPTPLPAGFPFRFLGRLDAGDETSLVLYGRGRTLTVRAAGPLDDEYVVDAIEEGHLTLRHLPSGTSHTIELASRQQLAPAAGPAVETPQD